MSCNRSRIKRESGTTLIELMVILLLLAILIGIGVPILVGYRNRGFDIRAKTNIKHGVTAAKVYYLDNNDSYAGMNANKLESLVSGIVFKDGADIGTPYDVYISNVLIDTFTISSLSMSGKVFKANGNRSKITYDF